MLNNLVVCIIMMLFVAHCNQNQLGRDFKELFDYTMLIINLIAENFKLVSTHFKLLIEEQDNTLKITEKLNKIIKEDFKET